ncbi:hypothetical protein R6Q57_003776 [Mikania cordata]
MAFFVTTNSLSRSLRFAINKPYYYASPIPSILTNSPTKVLVSRRRLVSSSMASDNESPSKNPGLRSDPPDEETKGYFVQQTMYRIKDPKVSLEFYSDVLGMSLLKRLDFPDMKFSLYFMGYEDTSSAPKDPIERTEWTFGRKATIELTHNWGTEDDPNFEAYHNGNSDPRGFDFGFLQLTVGLILLNFSCSYFTFVESGKKLGLQLVSELVMLSYCGPLKAHPRRRPSLISCDVEGLFQKMRSKACSKRRQRRVVPGEKIEGSDHPIEGFRRQSKGFSRQLKRVNVLGFLVPTHLINKGKMKGIAFIKDPDGYWIEIFDCKNVIAVAHAAASKTE